MDLLANLPYTTFDDFCIKAEVTDCGRMQLEVSNGGQALSYTATSVGDPVNYLLAAAVSVVTKQQSTAEYNGVSYAGDYLYVTHDLEPKLATWLFKLTHNELVMVVWNDMPPQFEELVENGFACELAGMVRQRAMPNIMAGLAFAIKDSPLPFVNALVKTAQNIGELKKRTCPTDTDWGYTCPAKDIDALKNWLLCSKQKV